jgi:hypothetical protein
MLASGATVSIAAFSGAPGTLIAQCAPDPTPYEPRLSVVIDPDPGPDTMCTSISRLPRVRDAGGSGPGSPSPTTLPSRSPASLSGMPGGRRRCPEYRYSDTAKADEAAGPLSWSPNAASNGEAEYDPAGAAAPLTASAIFSAASATGVRGSAPRTT